MTTKQLIALAKERFPRSAICVRADVWDEPSMGLTGISLWVSDLGMHFNAPTLKGVASVFLNHISGERPEPEAIIEEISNGNQPL